MRLPCACRSTDRTSDYESEDRGSSPRGRTFARLAQWESTWPTPRGHRGSIPSRSTGARTQLVAGLGCDPRSTGFDSRLAPQGRAVHWRDMRPVKSWLRLWEFESLPAHASPWQRILPPRFRTLAAQFDSGQGHQTAHSAGPATSENRRDTVEGLKRRISCIHRMYNSRCGRRAALGSGRARRTRKGNSASRIRCALGRSR